MVLRREKSEISLRVDGIGNVLDLPADSFQEPPGTLQGPSRVLIRSTCKWKDQLFLILDMDQALRLNFEGRVS